MNEHSKLYINPEVKILIGALMGVLQYFFFLLKFFVKSGVFSIFFFRDGPSPPLGRQRRKDTRKNKCFIYDYSKCDAKT